MRNYFSFECLSVKVEVFKCWKYAGVKVWQSHFKEIIDNSNSLIKRLFNFHAFFSNSDRKRYVSETAIGDLQLYLKRESGTGVFLWILQNF